MKSQGARIGGLFFPAFESVAAREPLSNGVVGGVFSERPVEQTLRRSEGRGEAIADYLLSFPLSLAVATL